MFKELQLIRYYQYLCWQLHTFCYKFENKLWYS